MRRDQGVSVMAYASNALVQLSVIVTELLLVLTRVLETVVGAET